MASRRAEDDDGRGGDPRLRKWWLAIGLGAMSLSIAWLIVGAVKTSGVLIVSFPAPLCVAVTAFAQWVPAMRWRDPVFRAWLTISAKWVAVLVVLEAAALASLVGWDAAIACLIAWLVVAASAALAIVGRPRPSIAS